MPYNIRKRFQNLKYKFSICYPTALNTATCRWMCTPRTDSKPVSLLAKFVNFPPNNILHLKWQACQMTQLTRRTQFQGLQNMQHHLCIWNSCPTQVCSPWPCSRLPLSAFCFPKLLCHTGAASLSVYVVWVFCTNWSLMDSEQTL